MTRRFSTTESFTRTWKLLLGGGAISIERGGSASGKFDREVVSLLFFLLLFQVSAYNLLI